MTDKELYYSKIVLHKLFPVELGKAGASFPALLHRPSRPWTVGSTA